MFKLNTYTDSIDKFLSYLTNNWACEFAYLLSHTNESHRRHSPSSTLSATSCGATIFKTTPTSNNSIPFSKILLHMTK